MYIVARTAWAREIGVSVNTIGKRIDKGWPIAQVLGFEARPRTPESHLQMVFITFKGETLCKAEWCRRLGISGASLDSRLRDWSLEEALTIPAMKRGGTRSSRITVRGETKTIAAWTKELGLKRWIIRNRLRAGWPPEEAVFGRPKPKDGCHYHPSRGAKAVAAVVGGTVRVCWACTRDLRKQGIVCSEINARYHPMTGCDCDLCDYKRTYARDRVREFYASASAEEREDRRAHDRAWRLSRKAARVQEFLSQFSEEERDFIADTFGDLSA